MQIWRRIVTWKKTIKKFITPKLHAVYDNIISRQAFCSQQYFS